MSSMKIFLSLTTIGGAVTFLVSQTMEDAEALTYYYVADEVIVAPKTFVGRRIRLGGYVDECSIFQKPGTFEFRFDVRPDHPHKTDLVLKHEQARGKMISVAYNGPVPDTFKDNAEVIATGVLREDGIFEARDLVAKCPSKYEAAEKDMVARPAKRDCSARTR
jgi:cytochrome c-type biogenesis protein CcmE